MYPINKILFSLLILFILFFQIDAKYLQVRRCIINCSNIQSSQCFSKSNLHFKWCLMKYRQTYDNCIKVCTNS